MDDTARLDRCMGALIGLAVGDALGTTLEFKAPGSFTPITDMVGGGPFHLEPGQWTDDTSMALCLAESLLECGGFDLRDQVARYVRWQSGGHLSSTGRCFDIGITVGDALRRFRASGDPYSGSTDPRAAGNGSIMRLAPVPMAFRQDGAHCIALSAESSRTTHGTGEAVDACRYFGGLVAGAIAGTPKKVLLAPRYAPVPDAWDVAPLAPKIDAIAAGSFKEKEPPAIKGSGYVVDSLEAALWAFYKSASFEEGALLAVNLGDDADTTGAVYGQIAGAYYGEQGIPAPWVERLAHLPLIRDYASKLAALGL